VNGKVRLTMRLVLAAGAVSLVIAAPANADVSATQVTSGLGHSCALAGGNVWCWGDNSVGQLGQGATGGSSSVPVQVTGLLGVTQISAGTYDTCAVKTDQSVWCWGTLGQHLGGPYMASPVQITINGLAGPFAAVAGGQFDTCGLSTSLTDLVCGDDGGRSVVGTHHFPSTVATFGLGAYEACAGLTDGTVWCFGDNGFGGPAVPALVAGPWGPASAIGVTADYWNNACATFSDGSAWCWDDNGGSSGFTQVLAPGSGATGIADQNGHACALVSGGGATCWTNTQGSFGNGPAVVPGLAGASQISTSGLGGGCALVSGGVKCWGDNSFGQLGDGTNTPSSTPVNVIGFTSAPPADTTAPTLTTPGNLTVNATSAAGATVTFTVTANDVDDAAGAVVCNPVSGSTFPIGTTTVNCQSTDTHSNTGYASFTVTVLGAAAQLSALAASLAGIDGNSFTAQLQAVGGKNACGTLNAFTNHVRAQSGKKLTTAAANAALAAAARIAAIIGC